MVEAPYLDLAYFVGNAGLEKAARSLVSSITVLNVPSRQVIPGVVGVTSRDEELITTDKGVLILRTEGDLFCGPTEDREQLWRLAAKVRARFIDVARQIDPVYGSILVESPLPTPSELVRDPTSLAFVDFYVSFAFAGRELAARIVREAGSDAHYSEHERGFYVAMTSVFGSQQGGVPATESQYRSLRISRLLAGAPGARFVARRRRGLST
jgi:hypothetical protein